MRRFHVHVSVKNLDESIQFYSVETAKTGCCAPPKAVIAPTAPACCG